MKLNRGIKILLAVGLPTVIVAGYVGYQQFRKHRAAKANVKREELKNKYVEMLSSRSEFNEEKFRSHFDKMDDKTVFWLHDWTKVGVEDAADDATTDLNKMQKLWDLGVKHYMDNLKSNVEFWTDAGGIIMAHAQKVT